MLALVDLVSDENLDEAVAMAQKARQLEPSRPGYSLLLAHAYVRKGNAGEARSILEPLTTNSDSAVRVEAQSLLNSIIQAGATASRNSADSRNTASLGSTITAEPVQSGSSRMIMGGDGLGGGAAIRDGQAIEQSESLPALDEVLARYVQALGGADAIKAC